MAFLQPMGETVRIACKRCSSESIVRNGVVRGQQRYRCRRCALNFVDGDRRVDDNLHIKRALAVVLYSIGKASFNMLGHIFGVSRSLTYRRIKKDADKPHQSRFKECHHG
ncbi:MAG: IS1 family transposase [Magnetococcales bacterium]|nr:IS1 family transposase [Magnetococcales bacterium]